MMAVVVVGMMTTTTESQQTEDYILTQSERIEFIRAHNRFRNDFATIYTEAPQPPAANMYRMYWSVLLEASAIDYSSECKGLTHGQTGMKEGPTFQNLTTKWGKTFGQNLFKGSVKPNLTSMIFAFANETKFFTYNPNNGGVCQTGKVCGHYTQVVWAATIYVGCAVTKCSDYWLGTCNYVGPGNYEGAPPYKSGAPCSQCGSPSAKVEFTDCDGRLCVPKDRCSPVTECNVIDLDNCLCSEADNRKIVMDLLNAATNYQTAPGTVILSLIASVAVSSSMMPRLV